jgi:hypothetical protein
MVRDKNRTLKYVYSNVFSRQKAATCSSINVKCKKFIDFHSKEKFLGSEVTQGKREMVAEGKWHISPTGR